MGRLKFKSDEDMRELKKDPWLDTVLAARRQSLDVIDDLVYLSNDGLAMYGFCQRTQHWLRAQGVNILLNCKIQSIECSSTTCFVKTNSDNLEFDHLVWSNDSYLQLLSSLGEDTDHDHHLQYGTPMLFYTFVTKSSTVKDFTYLQNFDPQQFTYRTAATGLFSNQIADNGDTFITSECPADTSADFWADCDNYGERVWQEVKDLGIVDANAPLLNIDVKRIPSSFKLAKVGYNNSVDKYSKILTDSYPLISLRDVKPFFRRDIYLDTRHLSFAD